MTQVVVQRPADSVALIQLNRPDRRNALSLSMRAEIAAAIRAAAADDSVRVLVLAGDERAFAAGADISELAQAMPLQDCFERLSVMRKALDTCAKPVIAAVRGFALGGGCELAMMCDIVVAGEGARFGLPEVRVGVMPGAGGTQRLLRAAGSARAMRWLLTGEMFDAATAAEMGLVSEVVPDAEVVARALAMAERIAGFAPHAVAAIKEAVRAGANAPLDAALMLENRLFQLLFATRDQKEGMRAFLEKRAPVFTGQ